MATLKKVYDFDVNKVKAQLVAALKKQDLESSVAALIATTGLPKFQVEQGIKVVSAEYAGHLKLTESGEILYYFPDGMVNQIHGFWPNVKRLTRQSMTLLAQFLKFLFKAWIMVMLIGYFILFVTILVAAIVAAIAASASSKDKKKSSSESGGLEIVLRLLEIGLRIFFYVDFSKKAKSSAKKNRPFYKSVFAFVFGEEYDQHLVEQQEKLVILDYIRSNKGVVIAEELSALTGKKPSDVQHLINQFLVDYEGEPMVIGDGTIIYFFPELLKAQDGPKPATQKLLPHKLISFCDNSKSLNGWIVFFNAFNLFFGSYFLYFSLFPPHSEQIVGLLYLFVAAFLPPTEAIFILMLSLGVVPWAFSLVFYMIPLFRNISRQRKNEHIRQQNLRGKVYTELLRSPQKIILESLSFNKDLEAPSDPIKFITKELDAVVGQRNGEYAAREDGQLEYQFTEIKQDLRDLAAHRNSIMLQDYQSGKTIMDSQVT